MSTKNKVNAKVNATGDKVTSEAQAPLVIETQAPAMEEQAPLAFDMEKALNELRKASGLLNDGKHKGAHASKLNSLYFVRVADEIAKDHGQKHAFDIAYGVALFLRHELRLQFKAKEKDGAARSVSIDTKASLADMESAKAKAYEAWLAYQIAIIAKEKAYKAGLLYARPAGE